MQLHISVMPLHRQSNGLLPLQMWKLDGQSNFPSYTQLVSHLIRSWKKHQGGKSPRSISLHRLTFQVVPPCWGEKEIHDAIAAVGLCKLVIIITRSLFSQGRCESRKKEEMFGPEEGFTPSPHPFFLLSLAECQRGSRCGSFKCQHVNRIMEQDVVTGTSNGQNFDARNVRSDVYLFIKLLFPSLKKKMGASAIQKKGVFLLCGQWNIDPGARPSLLSGTLRPRKIRSVEQYRRLPFW